MKTTITNDNKVKLAYPGQFDFYVADKDIILIKRLTNQ